MTPAEPPTTPLSRRRIVDTAIAFVDRSGLTALSMRQLGGLLGVEAMALYYYVDGREDLLEGMVEQVVEGVRVPPREPAGATHGWQAYLQHVAHSIRAIAVEHPGLFPLVATRPPAAPWLRPPLRNLPLVEDFLDGLVHRGLSDDDAVHVYKRFTGFLLGHLLLEVSENGVPTGPPEEPLDEGDADVSGADAQLDLEEFPMLRRLRARLQQHDAEAEFEAGLEGLLVRLDLELSQ